MKTALSVAALFAASVSASPALRRQEKSKAPVRVPASQASHGPVYNLTVGTPPQTIVMLDDWTWHSTWLYTPHCKGNYSVKDCVLPGQNFFDYEKSSTVQITNEPLQSFGNTDYTPGAPFTVNFGTDIACLPGGAANNVSASSKCLNGTLMEFFFFFFYLTFEIYIWCSVGLAPVLPGYNKTFQPLPYQLIEAHGLDRVAGWHMCENLKDESTCDGFDFLTIYGGTAQEMYNPQEMQYHDVVFSPCLETGNLSLTPPRDNYWDASWTGMWIGNQKINLFTPTTAQPDPPRSDCNTINPIAIFDSGAEGRGLPIPVASFDLITSITQAKKINDSSPATLNEGSQGLWEVPCGAVGGFPDLTYELSSKQNITVVPEMYIDQAVMPGHCLLNARVWDREVQGAMTFFGQNLNSRTYLKFDFDHFTVGVAPIKQSYWK